MTVFVWSERSKVSPVVFVAINHTEERAKAFDWIFVIKFGLIDLLFCFCTKDRRKMKEKRREEDFCRLLPMVDRFEC